jgi:hypothetical protein
VSVSVRDSVIAGVRVRVRVRVRVSVGVRVRVGVRARVTFLKRRPCRFLVIDTGL